MFEIAILSAQYQQSSWYTHAQTQISVNRIFCPDLKLTQLACVEQKECEGGESSFIVNGYFTIE